jgi:hypothetical protein
MSDEAKSHGVEATALRMAEIIITEIEGRKWPSVRREELYATYQECKRVVEGKPAQPPERPARDGPRPTHARTSQRP